MTLPALSATPGPLDIHRAYHIPLCCGKDARQIEAGKTEFAKAVIGLGPIRVCCGSDGQWRLDQLVTTNTKIIDAWHRRKTAMTSKAKLLNKDTWPGPTKNPPKITDVGDTLTEGEREAETALELCETHTELRQQVKP